MKKTILIIEDEKTLREPLKEELQENGFKVLEAENGESGLKSALEHHPDLILLDTVMPIMDGITMLKELKKEKNIYFHN